MKALSSFSVFRVPALEAGRLDELRDQVDRQAFRSPLPSRVSSQGWTSPTDPGELGGLQMLDGQWIAIGIRYDEKAIPPALQKLRLDEACKAWCREHARDVCPRGVKAELEETIKLDLLTTIPATPHTGIVLYDSHEGRLFVGAASGKVHAAAVAVWRETFGSAPEPVGVLDEIVHELDEETLEHLAEGDPEAGHLSFRPEQLGRFLAWLWWRGEASTSALPTIRRRHQNGVDGLDLSWIAAGGVTLADQASGARRLTVKAENAAADPAVRVALVDGHAVDGLDLTLRVGEHGRYEVGLAAKDGELVVRAVKIPKPLGADDLSALLETACCVDDVYRCLCDLFRAWATTVGHPERQRQALATFRVWLESDLLSWAGRQTEWGRKLLDVADGAG